MLRNMTKTVGSALAALCLVSTLAMAQAQQPQTQAQSPSQPMTPQHGNTTPQQGHRQNPPESRPMMKMTCVKDTGADGKEIVVNGEGLKSGAMMNCVDRGSVVDCEPASSSPPCTPQAAGITGSLGAILSL